MIKIPESEIHLILEIISRFPEGASTEQILLGLDPTPPRRTLQYRLAELVKTGHLIVHGATKGRRYLLASKERIGPKARKEIISLSSFAENIQRKVTAPIGQRKYVNYHRNFLDEYTPNETYYLSEPMRKNLHDMGKTDGDRPAGTHARQIYDRILIDLSWNSSRLEGNTYSLLETEKLIESGIPAEGKNRRETQMILNHKAAIEFLLDSTDGTSVDKFTILNIHALLAENLLLDSACGRLRTIAVGIDGSTYKPLDVPQLVSECFQQVLETANAIKNPFEQAFFLMVHLPYLQPFEDVNKRVSRLTANIPLFRENYCPLSFVEVPEQMYINGLLAIYELNQIELLREVFIWAYEKSCRRYSAARQTLGEPDPFRIQYRDLRKDTVVAVVRQGLDKKMATHLIRQTAKEFVPEEDQSKFTEVVETELMSLHEGNIARYKLRLTEFENWQKSWS